MGGSGAKSGFENISSEEKRRIAKVENALKSAESLIVDADHEIMVSIDNNGNTVVARDGKRSTVKFTVEEKQKWFTGNHGTHNHPDGGTLSPGDVACFLSFKMASISAVYKGEKWKLEPKKGVHADIEKRWEFKDNYKDAVNRIISRAQRLWGREHDEDEMSMPFIRKEIYAPCHNWIKNNAKEYGYDYHHFRGIKY